MNLPVLASLGLPVGTMPFGARPLPPDVGAAPFEPFSDRVDRALTRRKPTPRAGADAQGEATSPAARVAEPMGLPTASEIAPLAAWSLPPVDSADPPKVPSTVAGDLQIESAAVPSRVPHSLAVRPISMESTPSEALGHDEASAPKGPSSRTTRNLAENLTRLPTLPESAAPTHQTLSPTAPPAPESLRRTVERETGAGHPSLANPARELAAGPRTDVGEPAKPGVPATPAHEPTVPGAASPLAPPSVWSLPGDLGAMSRPAEPTLSREPPLRQSPPQHLSALGLEPSVVPEPAVSKAKHDGSQQLDARIVLDTLVGDHASTPLAATIATLEPIAGPSLAPASARNTRVSKAVPGAPLAGPEVEASPEASEADATSLASNEPGVVPVPQTEPEREAPVASLDADDSVSNGATDAGGLGSLGVSGPWARTEPAVALPPIVDVGTLAPNLLEPAGVTLDEADTGVPALPDQGAVVVTHEGVKVDIAWQPGAVDVAVHAPSSWAPNLMAAETLVREALAEGRTPLRSWSTRSGLRPSSAERRARRGVLFETLA